MVVTLQQLYERILQAFTKRAEVRQIYVFGSMEKQVHDDYSDIDLHVVSCDFDTTMKDLPSIMNEVGEPFVWYPFHPQQGNTAYAVLFRDYPLYNRLDITILDTVTPPIVPLGSCIYENPWPTSICPSTYQAEAMNERVRELYGYAIGAVRYAKYRKRGKPFCAYKFYRAQCDYYFLQLCGKKRTEMGLTTEIYATLDRLSESEWHQKYLYPQDEKNMDGLYLELLETMVRGETVALTPEHLEALTEIVSFLHCELALTHGERSAAS